MQSADIAAIRKDYQLATLDEHQVGHDPLDFFRKWFLEAERSQLTDVNAMTLATVDKHHKPHARTVLLKGLEDNGFVFFTNYESAKGQELANNPYAALLFYWKELERQVRIEGIVEKISAADSETYFHSRPRLSRIGAWASPQSKPIEGRHILEMNFSKYEAEFSNIEVPRPAHWGGYKLVPVSVEFWQGRPSRLHDRILFSLSEGEWQLCRIAP